MSRSGYGDGDCDSWATIRWRGAVISALRGKRGQAFMREMLAALDALPAKRLIAEDIEAHGEVCAIGAVGRARGVDMSKLNPYDQKHVAHTFGVPYSLACEIFWTNDEATRVEETPEQRFARVRRWVQSQIGRHRVMVEGDL